ncbi:type I inositol 1,4,5-trisphosphate 5-phosphatase [Austrofundulus limnaeus]|uniref:Type I inositol 1,4,5-trisphosphate 5-phosphatase n=1 Tax=Austrofundulus limnaeus TaxID=52670 RepID=A0A2I4AJD4_AUSLI|nr:PREDICTED: type I inositol 1,4,5-trisphosphate 5-phosphatase-like [Austrofundulus limnaeus]
MNTRCPAWCDRILMSSSARDLFLKPDSEEKSVTYDNVGPSVCMGDHKRRVARVGRIKSMRHLCENTHTHTCTYSGPVHFTLP